MLDPDDRPLSPPPNYPPCLSKGTSLLATPAPRNLSTTAAGLEAGWLPAGMRSSKSLRAVSVTDAGEAVLDPDVQRSSLREGGMPRPEQQPRAMSVRNSSPEGAAALRTAGGTKRVLQLLWSQTAVDALAAFGCFCVWGGMELVTPVRSGRGHGADAARGR